MRELKRLSDLTSAFLCDFSVSSVVKKEEEELTAKHAKNAQSSQSRKACGLRLVACSDKNEISTVQHSKQLVFKKAPRSAANEQSREACTYSVPLIPLTGGWQNHELTIRAC